MLLPTSPTWAKTITKLRASHDEGERRELKQHLPLFVPAGVHEANGKRPHSWSGLLCLDIDNHDEACELPDMKQIASTLPFVAYCGVSSGGNGYFMLIPISTPEHYEMHYNSLVRFFREGYGIVVDEACRTPSKFRFASIDDAPYINEDAERYCHKVAKAEKSDKNSLWAQVKGLDDKPATKEKRGERGVSVRNEDVEATKLAVLRLALMIDHAEIDVTEGYDTWRKVCFSLLSTFGEDVETARLAFHAVSKFNGGYIMEDCEAKFYEFAKGYRGEVTAATFVQICKEHGLELNRTPSMADVCAADDFTSLAQ